MYDAPACHCDSHQRRCATQSSTIETVWASTRPCADRSRRTSARAFNSGSADVMLPILAPWFKRSVERGNGSESEVAEMTGRGQRLIEVVALHPADAEGAQEGGADRVQVCAWVD